MVDAGAEMDEYDLSGVYDLSDVFDEPPENNNSGVAQQLEAVFLEEHTEKIDENQARTSFRMEGVAASLDEGAGYYSEDSDVVEVAAYYLDYEEE